MAYIAPFRGLRFNTEKIDNLEDVVTPPYDVIDDKRQAAFLAINPYNMINLDISKNPGQSKNTADRYSQAKKYFDTWQEEQILVRDQDKSIYLYYIDYALPSGRRLVRKGLVALVRLAEFAEGIVKPHEETFGTVTEDRLKLMDTCRAHFSQIFSLYSDQSGEIMARMEGGRGNQPLCKVNDSDGTRHTLWEVTDAETLKEVHRLFLDKSLYIADGHHRYTTALHFRRLLEERHGAMEEDCSANYAMMYLCPMEDPGLSVLPTHRLVSLPVDLFASRPTLDDIVDRLRPGFSVSEMKGGSREVLLYEVLARMDEHRKETTMFGLYHAGEDRCFLLSMKDEDGIEYPVSDRPAVLRDLDVVLLADLVVGKFLGLGTTRSENENLIRYYSDPDEALDVAVKESINDEDHISLLFLMNNTEVKQVQRVADENLIMPHKSTFFYPKVLTGLVMNKIDPDEKISI